MGILESTGNMIGKFFDHKAAKRRQRDASNDYWNRLEAMNTEPTQVSEVAPEYQQTKSPVARAYLESFLTGMNQDGTQGTRLGGDATKSAQQAQFNATYGGWDKLQQQSNNEISNNDRFKVTPITEPVRKEHEEAKVENKFQSDYEKVLGRPLTAEEAKLIADKQALKPHDSTFTLYTSNNDIARPSNKAELEKWLSDYRAVQGG